MHFINEGRTQVYNNQVTGFSSGTAICIENRAGGFSEEWSIHNNTIAYNGIQIRLFQNSASAGTNSYEYGTMYDNHFQLSDESSQFGCNVSLAPPISPGCIIGVSVEGVKIGSTQYTGNTFGNLWDIAYNINATSNGSNVVQAKTGGVIARTHITTRGEQTSGSAQSCLFAVLDTASLINTPVEILNKGTLQTMCAASGVGSQNAAVVEGAYAYGDSFFEPENAVLNQRVTKWTNHTGNSQGYLRIWAAAPAAEHDGGFALFSKANSVSSPESDTMNSTSDPPIRSVLVTEAASGGSVGLGNGWEDATQTGYNISSVVCSTGVITIASGTLPAWSSQGVLISGGTNTSNSTEIFGSYYTEATQTSSTTATIPTGAPCTNQTGGVIYPETTSTTTLDILSGSNGGFRLGSISNGIPTSTPYSQLATYAATVTSGSVTSCTNIDFTGSTAAGATPTTADLELTVIPPSPLTGTNAGIITPAAVATAGKVTLHLCPQSGASSFTYPGGTYKVVAIR